MPALLAMLLSVPVFANRRALPDQVIPTPVGTFRISDLKCDSIHSLGPTVLFVQGKLVNETNKSWDILKLAIEFRDKNGNVVLKGGPLVYTWRVPFGAGTTVKFSHNEFARADKDTLSVKFTFVDGRYPVHYRTALTTPAPSSNLEYRDDKLAISFSLQRSEIDFVLQNNSTDPIKVDWNSVSFIQLGGTAQGVIHKGIKFTDKNASKPPSIVPPRAQIEDMIEPIENVEFVGGDWLTYPLFPDGPLSLKMVGGEFSVFMPLDIGGAIKNYTFTLKILGVD